MRSQGPSTVEGVRITPARRELDRGSGLSLFSGQNRAPADLEFSLTHGYTNQVDETTWVWAKTGEGTWPGVDCHEICSDPKGGGVMRVHAL